VKTRVGAVTALTAALACGSAAASPITVNVRVEGAHHTLFSGKVKTDGHAISKDATGSHPCDGTNNGANPKPGATVHSALDDASKAGHFSWTAKWSPSFNDFFVTSIGPDAGSGSSFWGEAVNFKDTPSGGCQFELKPGDQVLLYFVASGTSKYTLKLSGSPTAKVGRSFKAHVIDGKTGKPVKGAKVGGHKTNASGVATLRFGKAGIRHLTATFAGSVRSNRLTVHVHS
jgi:hypothetical protein